MHSTFSQLGLLFGEVEEVKEAFSLVSRGTDCTACTIVV